MYELMAPLLHLSLKDQPPTIEALAWETAQILAYQSQSGVSPKITGIGKYTPTNYLGITEIFTPAHNLFYRMFLNLGNEPTVPETATHEDVRQIQTSKLRSLNQLFRLYSLGPKTNLLKDTLSRLQVDKNDRGISLLTSLFFKRLFVEEKEHVRTLLELARDYWLRLTLNSVDEEIFILDIIDSLSASLNLLSYLLRFEVTEFIDPPIVRDPKGIHALRRDVLAPMVHTIEAGYTSLQEQQDTPSTLLDPERAAADKKFKDEQIEVKRNQLHILRDLLERVNGEIDEAMS